MFNQNKNKKQNLLPKNFEIDSFLLALFYMFGLGQKLVLESFELR